MHEKKIKSLAAQIARVKKESGKHPRYSQGIWDQVSELRSQLSVAQIVQCLGISPAAIHKRTSSPQLKKNLTKTKSLSKVNQSISPTLAPISYGGLNSSSTSQAPIFEMELPSGVKIRIYS